MMATSGLTSSFMEEPHRDPANSSAYLFSLSL
jgi:hypothetical protein